MTIIPASALSPRDLSILGFNTAAQVRREVCELEAHRRSLASVDPDGAEVEIQFTTPGKQSASSPSSR